MPGSSFTQLGRLRSVQLFKRYLAERSIDLPCDEDLIKGDASPLAQCLRNDEFQIENRIAIQPMEGWDGTLDGRPTEATFRRWARFGASGAKLIWGGEAVAVRHDGRANPNQLCINTHSKEDLSKLRQTLIAAHQRACDSTKQPLIGLQLTHSGRYSRPNLQRRAEPLIVYHHPILDRRVGLDSDSRLLTDDEIKLIIEAYCKGAVIARDAGFDFVDLKHCHGYLGHEFLSAHTREGLYGGPFENRTRFLREIVSGIRAATPELKIAVRLSAFDTVPFTTRLQDATNRPGIGEPESFVKLLPYRWGFGVDQNNPLEADLTEPFQFLSLLLTLKIKLVNISAGSPYYNFHIQRPAFYPPLDGYLPPEEPLLSVLRQIKVTRKIKECFPEMIIVGSGYSYLQDFLPYVAQAVVRNRWADCIGLGRMALTYPTLLLDVINGKGMDRKKICRTFSDCTTAPRNGLRSGCYPLDDYYKESDDATLLKRLKSGSH
ncbi:MAG: NADH:flavin oxidoreductase [Pyrinomonadaceae bacterium]